MNKLPKLLFILTMISTLVISCGTPTPIPTADVPVGQLVVILVADTFSKPMSTKDSDEKCFVNPDGLGQDFGGRESSVTFLGAWHGKFVYSDLLHQIDISGEFNELASGGLELVSAPNLNLQDYSFIERADLYQVNGNADQKLLAVAVDTNGFNYNDILNNIPAAIDLFANASIKFGKISLPEAKKFVVNMSFVFVPCDPFVNSNLKPHIKDWLTLHELGAMIPGFDDLSADSITVEYLGKQYDLNEKFHAGVDAIPSLVNLRSKLGGLKQNEEEINNAIFNAFIVNLLYDPSVSPKWTYLMDELKQELGKYSDVVYVGAAGNFGREYPFAPAVWEFVISVSSHARSASPTTDRPVAEYSNWGEVQMDGDYWAATEHYGTSFVAPKFSFWAAWSLLGYDICPGNHTVLHSDLTVINQRTVAPAWDNFDFIGECQSQ